MTRALNELLEPLRPGTWTALRDPRPQTGGYPSIPACAEEGDLERSGVLRQPAARMAEAQPRSGLDGLLQAMVDLARRREAMSRIVESDG